MVRQQKPTTTTVKQSYPEKDKNSIYLQVVQAERKKETETKINQLQ